MKRFYSCLFFSAFACALMSQPSEGKFRFAFMTDIHLNSENDGDRLNGLKQALAKVGELGADFIVLGGDQLDISGGTSNYVSRKQADSLYVVLKQVFDANALPYYPTLGNHDRFWDAEKGYVQGDELFKNYFNESYYTFEKKGIHFFILNAVQQGGETGFSVGKQQLDWIQQELKKIPAEAPVVLSLHVPVYSLYYPLVENKYVFVDVISNYKELLNVFENHTLKLVLQGHQHIHEEIYLQGVQFITGGAVCANWWQGPFFGTKEGFLLIDVDDDDDFSWEYVDYGWEAKK